MKPVDLKDIVRQEVKSLISEIVSYNTFVNSNPDAEHMDNYNNVTSIQNTQQIYDHVKEASILARQCGLWDVAQTLSDCKSLLDSHAAKWNYDQRNGLPDGDADRSRWAFQMNESKQKKTK